MPEEKDMLKQPSALSHPKPDLPPRAIALPAASQGNLQLWRELFEQAEIIYQNRMKERPFKFQPQSALSFWDQLSWALYDCLTKVSEKDIKSKCEDFQLSSLQHLPSFLISSFTLISRIRQINLINALCDSHNCIFLKHLNQQNDPIITQTGFLCIGITFDWAQKLYSNPPKKEELEDPGPTFKKYRVFLDSLRREEFPAEFSALDTHIGAIAIDKYTILYKKFINEILDVLGPPTFYSDASSGKTLGLAVLKFLDKQYQKKQEPIIILEATLSVKNLMPHVIGIARIQQDGKVFYRFCDADFGEFQANSAEQFPDWLKGYFETLNYNFDGLTFSLRRIDEILNRINPLMDALQLKKSQPPQLTLQRSITRRPPPPLPSPSQAPAIKASPEPSFCRIL